MGLLVEYAIGSASGRNHIATSERYYDSLVRVAREKQDELYRSVFYFDESILAHLDVYNSVKSYSGTYHPDHLVLDIDYVGDIETINALHKLVEKIDHLGVDIRGIRYQFSGGGFHIYLHKDLFNWKPSKSLYAEYGQWVIDNFGNTVDETAYSRMRLMREENTFNNKRKLFKVRITRKEVEEFDFSDYRDLAREPRDVSDFPDFVAQPKFDVEKYGKKIVVVDGNYQPRTLDGRFANRSVNTCLHNMFEAPLEQGKRHVTIITMASLIWRQGTPLHLAKAGLREKVLSEYPDYSVRELDKMVTDAYKRGYTPACDGASTLSKIMQGHCDKSCRFYKDLNSSVEVIDAGTAEERFRQKILAGDSALIDFASFCGYDDKDLLLERENLVVLLGPPGRNKTALVQNLLIKNKVSTLFLSLEMSEKQMFRRFQQISHNLTKQEVVDIYANGGDLSTKEFEHIDMVTTTLDMEGIKQIISKKEYKIIVIDHLKLLKAQSAAKLFQELAVYTKQLKQLANRRGYLIIVLSQVGREYGRGNQELDMHAGSGTAGTEEDSDIVMSISGDEDSQIRELRIHKNRDGDRFRQFFIVDGPKLILDVAGKEQVAKEARKKKPVQASPVIRPRSKAPILWREDE